MSNPRGIVLAALALVVIASAVLVVGRTEQSARASTIVSMNELAQALVAYSASASFRLSLGVPEPGALVPLVGAMWISRHLTRRPLYRRATRR